MDKYHPTLKINTVTEGSSTPLTWNDMQELLDLAARLYTPAPIIPACERMPEPSPFARGYLDRFQDKKRRHQ